MKYQNEPDYIPDDEYSFEFEDIVEEYGYEFDHHHPETEDGYILSLFRVRKPNLEQGAPVVFFMHGLLDSSDGWVMNGRDDSPAFIMAEAGYDVWLGNSRGSRFSREHKDIEPDSYDFDEKKAFWNFSW